ncbi:MAG: response regulator [Gammaproteobacteria bacterium]|nr:response regulator [Gammaproteobacteria bacterium]MDH3559854.1 response regulator [Gammaproteobacteria bacterium]
MANRLALIVDDSKTARVTLQRMLEKQGIDVDALESAQDALNYLAGTTPDLIFMDHMMPGMDGFQAVEAIKGNPDTATIPIMMYTSKGGDLYVSQARALGAIGIMPKEVQPAELFEVLNRLGMVENRRKPPPTGTSRFVLLDEKPEISLKPGREAIHEIAREAAESVNYNNELQLHLGELLERYHNDLSAEIQRLRDDLGQPVASGTGPGAHRSTARSGGVFVPLVVLLILLIPLLWMYRLSDGTREELEGAREEIARLQNQQQQQVQLASAENASLRGLLNEQKGRSNEQSSLLFKSIAWAINQSSPYDVREEAFSDRRLAIVHELVARLQALGFKGTLRLESYLGEFCLVGNDVDGYTLAPADLPVRDCDVYGHPLQHLPAIGERQSIAFANFLSTSPLVNDSDIDIEIVSHQYSQPRVSYPARDSDISAYEWNRIAEANNRVEVELIPASL